MKKPKQQQAKFTQICVTDPTKVFALDTQGRIWFLQPLESPETGAIHLKSLRFNILSDKP